MFEIKNIELLDGRNGNSYSISDKHSLNEINDIINKLVFVEYLYPPEPSDGFIWSVQISGSPEIAFSSSSKVLIDNRHYKFKDKGAYEELMDIFLETINFNNQTVE